MEMICSSNGEKEEETKEEDIEEDGEEEDAEEQQHFHVLAVDDSLIDRKYLEKLLRVSSCQVTCVDSGDKALEYLGLVDNLDHNASASCSSSHSPQHEGMKVNLIMTDYCMPGMSGYDLLKRVKESSWKDVPVVVMSSENIPSRISMCLKEGAEEFLLKPVQLSDVEKLQPHLLKSLDNHLSRTKTNDTFDDSDNNNVINNDNSNNISNNSSISKRKALSPESSDRRPKLKGLAVV